jgi:hypothetical protein
MERAIKIPQLINLSRKGLDFFKDAQEFLFTHSTGQLFRDSILHDHALSSVAAGDKKLVKGWKDSGNCGYLVI